MKYILTKKKVFFLIKAFNFHEFSWYFENVNDGEKNTEGIEKILQLPSKCFTMPLKLFP